MLSSGLPIILLHVQLTHPPVTLFSTSILHPRAPLPCSQLLPLPNLQQTCPARTASVQHPKGASLVSQTPLPLPNSAPPFQPYVPQLQSQLHQCAASPLPCWSTLVAKTVRVLPNFDTSSKPYTCLRHTHHLPQPCLVLAHFWPGLVRLSKLHTAPVMKLAWPR